MEALLSSSSTSHGSSEEMKRHTWLLAPEEFGSPPFEMKSAGPLLRGGGFTAPMHMARRARHNEASKAWRHSSLKLELSRHARVDDTSITNLLGSSLEGYHLLTPLMPIEEEHSCLTKCWPGSGGEEGVWQHAGPSGDDELAKSRPRQAPLQGASSFGGGGGHSFAIDWGLAARLTAHLPDQLPWPTLDDVASLASEAAADAKDTMLPTFPDVSHAFPSFASLWEPEGSLL